MNARILEIFQNPRLITETDTEMLRQEIAVYPYSQALRVLYLYGVKNYKTDTYKDVLAEAAAYTTDKKMLYRFINKEEERAPEIYTKTAEVSEKKVIVADKISVEDVFPEKIIVEEISVVKPEIGDDEISVENVIPKEIIVEEIAQNTENVDVEPELSFHAVDDFLPQIKLSPKPELFAAPPSQKNSNQNDEMARLIAEVEAKMKANKAKKSIEKEEDIKSFSIDFSENEREVSAEIPVAEEQIQTENPGSWVPMNFNNPTPDALLGQEQPAPKKPTSEPEKNPEVAVVQQDRNVGQFINTWHSWLQLGRNETTPVHVEKTTPAPVPEEILVKPNAVDAFIENEPKISKLKKDFPAPASKDRGDDISHLMTETLARLYFEQKLYSKASDAYEVLKKKYPENSKIYNQEIRKIKDLRQNFK